MTADDQPVIFACGKPLNPRYPGFLPAQPGREATRKSSNSGINIRTGEATAMPPVARAPRHRPVRLPRLEKDRAAQSCPAQPAGPPRRHYKKETGEVVGVSCCSTYDPVACELDIGWTFLARSRWGGRDNKELKPLILDQAVAVLNGPLLMVDVDNARSQKAVERLGATEDRIIPATFESGRIADHIVDALTGLAWHTRK